MIVKQHIHSGRLVLAVCDDDLIGEVFEEKGVILDLSSAFYKGKAVERKIVKELIKKAYIINAVGRSSINLLIKEGAIEEKSVLSVSGAPYSLVVFEAKR